MLVEVTAWGKGVIQSVRLFNMDSGNGYLSIGNYLDGYGAAIGCDKYSKFLVKATTYEAARAAYDKVKAEWVNDQEVLELTVNE